ncbi:glycosyltransferase family 1 protein [Microbacterium sp. AGC85]
MTSTDGRARVLILCFDDISIDPRVLKQVNRLVRDYDVTTCSPGPRPHRDVEHLELHPDEVIPRGRIGNLIDDIAREREWFTWTYRQIPFVKQTKALLRGRRFDAVIANDAETVGVAIECVGADRVHADLHEFFPGLPVEDSMLGLRQRRYWTWLIEKHASQARSSTTVGNAIAQRYAQYGLRTGVVTNATNLRDLPVRPTSTPIRLVHSGNPFRERGLADIMRAVAASSTAITLDLYLTYNPPADREQLSALAARLGERITVHEPVTQDVLVETLNGYDVGIHVLPPTSENNSLALPNKFFDFVQARLGVIVGPSIEMANLVREHELGEVTETFDESAIREALDGLTRELVDRYKDASDRAAPMLSAESQVETWAESIAAIISADGAAAR